jgi:site-specific DNA recombinase
MQWVDVKCSASKSMNSDNSVIPSKLVAVYARVCTARQEEDGAIGNQWGVLREFSQKNDLTIVKEYIDDGPSGDILARPTLDELRADVGKKIWNSVLIYDPDRLARRYSY